MDSAHELLIERGVISVSEPEWERARLRTQVIAPLAKLKTVTRALADNAADQLGISRRQVYALIQRYRLGDGLVTDMLLNKSHGGKRVLRNIV